MTTPLQTPATQSTPAAPISGQHAPRATYRLQLAPDFTYDDAAAVLPYLADLGISDVYLSPIFEAAPGSTHGYNVADPTRARDELGGEPGLRRLLDACKARNLSVLIDIVPNHMAAHPANPWWRDVLGRGRNSEHADVFDIDWDAGGGKVTLPILGKEPAEIIAAGELKIEAAKTGPTSHELVYYATRLPIADGTLDGPAERADIAALLERQHYRLAFWRKADQTRNYRRFFDINDLVGVRVEHEPVFAKTHTLIASLLASGDIHGLRVDHIDGLADPLAYLRRLRKLKTPHGRAAYLVVEKILEHEETLPDAWPVDGTTGYEFTAQSCALFIDPAGEEHIDSLAHELGAARGDFPSAVKVAKRQAIEALFPAELRRLTRDLAALAAHDGWADAPEDALAATIRDTTVAMDVYRTYIDAQAISADDRERIEEVTEPLPDADSKTECAMALLRRVLLGEGPFAPGLPARDGALAFITRWQQFTGPATAKGVEDTAFYRHIGLVAMNEVGAGPRPLADAHAEFHAANAARAGRYPLTLNATATHDTKRGEDTRLRISALSEHADAFSAAARRWFEFNTPLRRTIDGEPAPTPAHEFLFYQSYLGIVPYAPASPATQPTEVADRLAEYLLKAARESKTRTSWLDQNAAYEEALTDFVRGACTADEGRAFREDAARTLALIARPAAVAGLSQTLLRLASPGVPDTYRGTELWDFSLVDPDNRRAVDFAARREALAALRAAASRDRLALLRELTANWHDGRVKLYTLVAALDTRRNYPDAFLRGSYTPLPTTGAHAHRFVAFARAHADRLVITVAPRLASPILRTERGEADTLRIDPGDTAVSLPDRLLTRPTTAHEAFTGTRHDLRPGAPIPLRTLLAHFPLALLTARV